MEDNPGVTIVKHASIACRRRRDGQNQTSLASRKHLPKHRILTKVRPGRSHSPPTASNPQGLKTDPRRLLMPPAPTLEDKAAPKAFWPWPSDGGGGTGKGFFPKEAGVGPPWCWSRVGPASQSRLPPAQAEAAEEDTGR